MRIGPAPCFGDEPVVSRGGREVSEAFGDAGALERGHHVHRAWQAILLPPVEDRGRSRIRALRDVWWHAGGNVLMVLIQLVSWYLRFTEGPAAIVPTGLILSAVAVVIMLFTGWKGWQMVYRHHVGVSDEQDVPPYRQPRPTA